MVVLAWSFAATFIDGKPEAKLVVAPVAPTSGDDGSRPSGTPVGTMEVKAEGWTEVVGRHENADEVVEGSVKSGG